MNSNEQTSPESTPSTSNVPAEQTVVPATLTFQASETAGATEATTSTSESEKTFSFTASGLVKGTVVVPSGTKVEDALQKIDPEVKATTVSMRDSSGKAIGAEHHIVSVLSVTVVKKASSG